MGNVVRVEFTDSQGPDISWLLGRAMLAARRRAGLSPDEFALALRRRCRRDPGLTADSIRAYEAGRARPRGDVYIAAISVADPTMLGRLEEWIAGAR